MTSGPARREPQRTVSYVIPYESSATTGHLLGVTSLCVDREAKVLYSAGRDGSVIAWRASLDNSSNSSSNNNNSNDNDGGDGDTGNNNDHDNDNGGNKRQTSWIAASQHHVDWINSIALCPVNGRRFVASASSDRTVKLWRPPTAVHHETALVDGTDFGADNDNDNDDNGGFVTIGSHSDFVKVLGYASEANTLVSGSCDRKIKLWDLERASLASSSSVTTTTTQSTSTRNSSKRASGTLHSYCTVEQRYEPLLTIPETSSTASIYSLATTPSANLIASGTPDRVINLYDRRAGVDPIAKLAGHTDNVRSLVLSSDGYHLLSGSSDATVKLWSIGQRRCLTTFALHSDSVWTIHSDDSMLRRFYSSGKDGLVAKVAYTGVATDVDASALSGEVGDPDTMCVALARENSGVMAIAAADEQYVFTATNSSTIRGWNDINLSTRDEKNIPRASILNSVPDDEIIIDVDASDDEAADDVVPLNSRPALEFVGRHGLTQHVVLNNKRHVVAIDTSCRVCAWDLLTGSKIKDYGVVSIDEVVSKLNTRETVPNWCSVDTRIGSITVHLTEGRSFETIAYHDSVLDPDDPNTLAILKSSDEPRFVIGSCVLRWLFEIYVRARLALGPEGLPPSRFLPLAIQSQPGTTVASGTATPMTAVSTAGSVSATSTAANTISSAALAAAAAATAAQTAAEPIGPRPSKSRGFFGIGFGRNKDNSTAAVAPALPSPSAASNGSSNPHAINSKQTNGHLGLPKSQSTANGGNSDGSAATAPAPTTTKSGFMGKFRKMSTRRKDGSPQSLHTPEHMPPPPPLPTIPAQTALQSPSAVDQQQAQPHPDTASSTQPTSEEPLPEIVPIVETLPSFDDLYSQYPPLQVAPGIAVYISEESFEASAGMVLFYSTIDRLAENVQLLERAMPSWLTDFLVRGYQIDKETIKYSFKLQPSEKSSSVPAIPNAGIRLNAQRMLRVKKIRKLILDSLNEMYSRKQVPAAPSSSSSSNAENTSDQTAAAAAAAAATVDAPAYFSADDIEIWCSGEKLDMDTTLATVKGHVWRSGGPDIIFTYDVKSS
ncbi:WD40 repeat-like protein [Ramicandelaber brevisporus]|nr:WD40 repeat-like protein [Ramicandelaber brevisporus]